MSNGFIDKDVHEWAPLCGLEQAQACGQCLHEVTGCSTLFDRQPLSRSAQFSAQGNQIDLCGPSWAETLALTWFPSDPPHKVLQSFELTIRPIIRAMQGFLNSQAGASDQAFPSRSLERLIPLGCRSLSVKDTEPAPSRAPGFFQLLAHLPSRPLDKADVADVFAMHVLSSFKKLRFYGNGV